MKTKGILMLVLSIVFLFTLKVNAQFKYGIKEGINLSTQSEFGMLWDNNKMKTGLTLGVVFDYRFQNTLGIQTEINYKSEGLRYNENESTGENEINKNYYYYNIPLLVKTRFSNELGLSESWLVSFYGGPYYSYLHSSESEIKTNDLTTVTDYRKIANDYDMGLIFGGEVARVFKNKSELFFDIRYEMGLNDVAKNDDIKNKVIGLNIGFRF